MKLYGAKAPFIFLFHYFKRKLVQVWLLKYCGQFSPITSMAFKESRGMLKRLAGNLQVNSNYFETVLFRNEKDVKNEENRYPISFQIAHNITLHQEARRPFTYTHWAILRKIVNSSAYFEYVHA